MKNTTFILKLAAILFAIVFVCTFVLVLCNNITAPIIAQNNAKAEEEAKIAVLPNAEAFEEIKDFTHPGITAAFEGKDKSGNFAGYCFKVSTKDNTSKAFGGEIQMIVGIDKELNISGVKIITMAETPGLGAKASEEAFTDQYKGKADEISVTKSGNAGEGEINAISGATITSKAVTEGVNNALGAANVLKGKEAK